MESKAVKFNAVGNAVLVRDAMSVHERDVRANIRNFLMVATMAELIEERDFSISRKDHFRAACIQELIDEM